MTTPSPFDPSGVCGRTACSATPVVHWSRRYTTAELALIPEALHTDDMRQLVYACGTHAITLDLAAHIHAATCSGPNSAGLPTCDCTPEPLPVADMAAVTTLPTGWQVAT